MFTYTDAGAIVDSLWAMGEEEYVINRFCNDKTMYIDCRYEGPIYRAALTKDIYLLKLIRSLASDTNLALIHEGDSLEIGLGKDHMCIRYLK